MNSTLLSQIISFLRGIGLVVVERPIAEATVLPGITVEHGTVVADRVAIKYPGDLLHEAGHLAVVPASERELMNDNVGNDGGMEMGAIAWSYAAALHLGIAPTVLFHEGGYRGDSSSLIENFEHRRYIGVPILVWRGLADMPASPTTGATGFPVMKRWLTA